MTHETRRRILMEIGQEIKSLGYDVYIIADRDAAFGYIVNEKNEIGYFEVDYYGMCTFHTLHKANREYGSGFKVLENMPEKLTRKYVDRVFCIDNGEFPYAYRYIKKWNADEYFADLAKYDMAVEKI